MCGIAGVIDIRSAVTEPLLAAMRNELRFRGPDTHGQWIDPCGQIGLAHQRLSILDLSPLGNQPMMTKDGTHLLVYNGEMYNFRHLRKELEDEGRTFYTQCDTEVMLHALIQWGRNAIVKFHGPFAFAFYDLKKKQLLLARDRIGEKPLYYFHDGSCFAFASELKAIEKIPSFKKDIDEHALIDYLTFGYVPSPRAIWKNTYKLEPGYTIQVDLLADTEIKVSQPIPYWSMVIHCNNNSSQQQKEEQFRTLLKEISLEMMIADVPLGILLSGGVDSSSIVAALGQQEIIPDTYSIGFAEDGFNELSYARKVTKQYRTNSNELVLSTDHVSSVFDLLVNYLDEPFNDYSYIPTYYVTREARKNVTVCLSGDGADELFCGYQRYPRTQKIELLNKIIPPSFRKVPTHLITRMMPDYSDYKRHVLRLGFSENDFLFDLLAPAFKPRELQRIAGPVLKRILNQYHPIHVVNGHLNMCREMDLDLVNKLRYLDLKLTLPEDMLVKVDRTSMVNSLEVRPVYLHPRMIDFALGLPTTMLVNHSIGKYLPKKALETWLPPDILYRPKMGFGLPLNTWFFGDLHEVLNHGLDNLPKDWFDKTEINKLLANHLKGKRDFILQIHCLVFLGCWLASKGIKG